MTLRAAEQSLVHVPLGITEDASAASLGPRVDALCH